MKTLLILLFATFSLSDNSGGSFALTGTILNEDNQAIPGVNIVIKGTSEGTVTNQEGKFTLAYHGRQPEITLVYAFVRYRTREQKISLSEKNTEVGEIHLRSKF